MAKGQSPCKSYKLDRIAGCTFLFLFLRKNQNPLNKNRVITGCWVYPLLVNMLTKVMNTGDTESFDV